MSSIELKPCPFCGENAAHLDKAYSYYSDMVIYCENCDTVFSLDDCNATEEQIVAAWNRRVDNKSNRQSCKTCKYYAPDPSYRNGDMGNCRYLEKIWEKPFYVNEARTECEHFQAAERRNENGNET